VIVTGPIVPSPLRTITVTGTELVIVKDPTVEVEVTEARDATNAAEPIPIMIIAISPAASTLFKLKT
jgi:hypothetical protein